MAAPHNVGSAVRPSASEGNLTLGEITTPAAHESDPSNTARSPNRLDPFVTSVPVRMATPPTPTINPSMLKRVIFCCPIIHASATMNIGSVAVSTAARPEPTYCSAQCSVPCPTRKISQPTVNPEIQC